MKTNKLYLLVFLLLITTVPNLFSQNNPPNAPTDLKCKGITEPDNIYDFTPDLSWIFSDSNTGDTQSAHRLIFSKLPWNIEDNIGEMWDTGKVILSTNIVIYAGEKLEIGWTYYWKVMTWDNHDSSGTYSETASFGMTGMVGWETPIKVSTTKLDFGEVKLDEQKIMYFDIIHGGGPGPVEGTIETDKDWIQIDKTSFYSNFFFNEISITVTVNNKILRKNEGHHTGKVILTWEGNNVWDSGTIDIDITVKATCILSKPNPYNPTKGVLTFFGSGIVPKDTKIKIYTLNGKLVRTLEERDDKSQITWDGTNEQGKPVTNGIYIYTHESPKEKGVGKFTVIRE